MIVGSSSRMSFGGFLCLVTYLASSSSSLLVCAFTTTSPSLGVAVDSSLATSKLFSEVSSSSSSSEGNGLQAGVDRRGFVSAALLVGLSSVAAAAGAGWKLQQRNDLPTTVLGAEGFAASAAASSAAASVEDVVVMIDSQCDRRFLHALVATDYQQLLYRGVTVAKNSNNPILINSNSPSSPTTTPVAQDFLNSLSTASLVEEESSGSNTPYHLTTTGYKPKQKGQVMSLWPLGRNIHFAWPKEAGQQDLLFLGLSDEKQIIVDGIDCGVMSLEDALERPQGQQVMVYADSYLLVPTSMEQALISKLKDSFII